MLAALPHVTLAGEVGIFAGAAAAIVAAVLGFRKLAGQLKAALVRQSRIDAVLQRELNGDPHGMKAQVTRIVAQLDEAHREAVAAKEATEALREDMESVQTTLDNHVADIDAHAQDPHAHSREDWPDDGPAGPRCA